MIKLIECPRDAMQGIHDFIPTALKIEYINSILKVGFDTVDFGSFVSPKAIPQLRDTADVLEKLDLDSTSSKLLAIIANERGAHDACNFEQINYLGFPFSISEQFQQRNTNSSIEESLKRVEAIQNLSLKHNKTLVIYISMAFGNPYQEAWNAEIAIKWTSKLVNDLGIKVIALSDTIGVSNPENIKYMFENCIPEFPHAEIGAHLHTTPFTWHEKIHAAYEAGCRRFDGAIQGFGGCPMASDALTGNMATENIIQYLESKNLKHHLNLEAFNTALKISNSVFIHE